MLPVSNFRICRQVITDSADAEAPPDRGRKHVGNRRFHCESAYLAVAGNVRCGQSAAAATTKLAVVVVLPPMLRVAMVPAPGI